MSLCLLVRVPMYREKNEEHCEENEEKCEENEEKCEDDDGKMRCGSVQKTISLYECPKRQRQRRLSSRNSYLPKLSKKEERERKIILDKHKRKLQEFFKSRQHIGPQVHQFLKQIYPDGHQHFSLFQEVFTRMLSRKDGDFSKFDVSTLATLQKEIYDLNIIIAELTKAITDKPNSEHPLTELYEMFLGYNDCLHDVRQEFDGLRQEIDEVNQGLNQVSDNQIVMANLQMMAVGNQSVMANYQYEKKKMTGKMDRNFHQYAKCNNNMKEAEQQLQKAQLQNEEKQIAFEQKRLDLQQVWRAEDEKRRAKEKAEKDKRRAKLKKIIEQNGKEQAERFKACVPCTSHTVSRNSCGNMSMIGGGVRIVVAGGIFMLAKDIVRSATSR